MDGWTLCFVLLLPLTVCCDSEVTLVKTLGSKPDVTPICTSETMNIITLIICKIRTERSRGEECRLLYQYRQNLDHGCDSRFTLMTENQTVFLHLSSLTAEDSGNYTCECSRPEGTNILHLNVTVEEEEESSRSTEMPVAFALIGVTIVIIISGVIVGFIHWTKGQRQCLKSATSGTSVRDSPSSVNQDDPDDLYTSLRQPTNDVYQTVSSIHTQHDTRTSSAINNQEVDGRETAPNCKMYENINEDSTTV